MPRPRSTARRGGAAGINAWVADRTRGSITELVSDDALRDSLSVLVNAVYFNAAWEAVETVVDVYFTLPAFPVPPGERRTLKRAFGPLYGPLPPGEYRFVTDVSLRRVEGGYDHKTLAAEFVVE